jgi:hypothetical protein
VILRILKSFVFSTKTRSIKHLQNTLLLFVLLRKDEGITMKIGPLWNMKPHSPHIL